jgi:hypothetical protein
VHRSKILRPMSVQGHLPEVANWTLMSARADSGRATGSAWVRVVPGVGVGITVGGQVYKCNGWKAQNGIRFKGETK